MEDKLKASEALYGFVAWLSIRGDAIAPRNCTPWSDAINTYCMANNLSGPRENFQELIVYPEKEYLQSNECFDGAIEVYLECHGWKKLLSWPSHGEHEGLVGDFYEVEGFGSVHESNIYSFRKSIVHGGL